MNRGTEQTFFQRRHTDRQQVYEKILSITNKDYNEILPHTFQNGSYQKDKK